MTALAIQGGTPVLEKGAIQKWPPIDDTDKDLVLQSLYGENHAFGPESGTTLVDWTVEAINRMF